MNCWQITISAVTEATLTIFTLREDTYQRWNQRRCTLCDLNDIPWRSYPRVTHELHYLKGIFDA